MPVYTYLCEKCGNNFQTFHSMSIRLENCDKCGEKECLERIPGQISYDDLKERREQKKIGEITKDFIENSRKDLEEMKKEMKNKEYKL